MNMRIPKPTLERLPLYHRAVESFMAKGREAISSQELGREIGVDDYQVRKDLSWLGAGGRPGYGYDTSYLLARLEEVLGLAREHTAVVIGAGHLGSALSQYSGFRRYGLQILALFDRDVTKVGKYLGDIPIFDIRELGRIIKEQRIPLAIITVPAREAQRVVDLAVEAGVKAIWNFAPASIQVPPGIILRNEDLAVGLATLSHYIVYGQPSD